MNATRRLAFIAVLCFGVLVPGPTAAAGTPCSQRVLVDWSDNGRIDRVYALPCYQEAIATLPTDLRDYTNAHDVIDRALTNAVRGKARRAASETQASARQAPEPTAASTALSVPLPLLALAGLALGLLAASVIGRLGRGAWLGEKRPRR